MMNETAAARGRDEHYVVDFCEIVLGSHAHRQHTFEWLVGDPAARGARRRLPVDAYWPELRLVVEFHEVQHRESTPFFDKPDRMTVSGVSRGEQRRLYDERRRVEIPRHGLQLVKIASDQLALKGKRLARDVDRDRATLERLLAQHLPS